MNSNQCSNFILLKTTSVTLEASSKTIGCQGAGHEQCKESIKEKQLKDFIRIRCWATDSPQQAPSGRITGKIRRNYAVIMFPPSEIKTIKITFFTFFLLLTPQMYLECTDQQTSFFRLLYLNKTLDDLNT